jgi:hypothetical protein
MRESVAGAVEIIDGKAVSCYNEFGEKCDCEFVKRTEFHCEECGKDYSEMHERSGHEMSIYEAAQEEKKKK